MPPAPTAAQVQSLYNATKQAASKFTTYNFRTHFLRRADEVFRPVLASMESGPSSTPATSATLGTATPLTPEALAKFYEEHVTELEVLKRSADINRAFEGPKLVVEHPRIITGGGGAGAEAGQGGGGQPS